METDLAERIRTPMVPGVTVWLMPVICRPLMTTRSFTPALMVIPGPPATRIDPSVLPQLNVIALIVVTPPNPPGSRQLISPPAAVLEIAPAKVLQGAVRLQGLASSP